MTPVFLLSLPRSGSTLLQRMLGAHPEVATASEPWILLPALYARVHPGVHAEYSHQKAVQATEDFITTLDGGLEGYRHELREFAQALYRRAGAGERVFLDKTPRYSLVAEELLATFPDATVIILWRNPLAVVASLVDTWLHDWMPQLHAVDLYTALSSLVALADAHDDRVVTIRYEDLVRDPEAGMRRLVAALGLDYHPDVIRELSETPLDGRLGDHRGAAEYDGVSTASLGKYQATLAGAVRKRWMDRYLRWIGPDRLATMGYDLADLRREVRALPSRGHPVWKDLVNLARGALIVRLEPHRFREKRSRLPTHTRQHYYS